MTGTPSSFQSSGNNYIYSINIDGVTNGADLVARIIAGTDNGHPNNHYTKLAADATNPAKMYIYDDRCKNTEAATRPADWIDGTSKWQNWDYPYFSVKSSTFYGKFGEGVIREKKASSVFVNVLFQQII